VFVKYRQCLTIITGIYYQGKIYLFDGMNTYPEIYDINSNNWTVGLKIPVNPGKYGLIKNSSQRVKEREPLQRYKISPDCDGVMSFQIEEDVWFT